MSSARGAAQGFAAFGRFASGFTGFSEGVRSAKIDPLPIRSRRPGAPRTCQSPTSSAFGRFGSGFPRDDSLIPAAFQRPPHRPSITKEAAFSRKRVLGRVTLMSVNQSVLDNTRSVK